MIRGARASSAFLRSAAAAGTAGRCSGSASSAATRLGVISRHQGHGHQWAFASGKGQARLLSVAPSSVDDKKDGPKPEGFMKRVMGKESCVVRVYDLLERYGVPEKIPCPQRAVADTPAIFGCTRLQRPAPPTRVMYVAHRDG